MGASLLLDLSRRSLVEFAREVFLFVKDQRIVGWVVPSGVGEQRRVWRLRARWENSLGAEQRLGSTAQRHRHPSGSRSVPGVVEGTGGTEE